MFILDSTDPVKPPLRVSYEAKVKDDYAWAKRCIQYYIRQSNFYAIGYNKLLYQRNIQMLYDVYNNNIPEEYFHYITNPLGSTQAQFTNFPAKIRPYNIIRPNIDLFLGEFNKRYFNYLVVVEGGEGYNRYLEGLSAALRENLNQHFINKLNELGADTGLPSKEAVLPEDVERHFQVNFRDNIAIEAKKWLGLFEKRESVKEKALLLFKDWLIAGEAYSYKNVDHGEVVYDRVSPLFIDYDKSIDSPYIEDGQWVTRLLILTMADIIEMFYDEFEDADVINKIDWSTYGLPANISVYGTNSNALNFNREFFKEKKYLIHCTWTAQEKVGVLTCIDKFTGQEITVEVDENYKLNKEAGDISIKWQWRNQGWEGYYLGNQTTDNTGGDVKIEPDKNYSFFRIRPIPVQRHEIDNKSTFKLPYNGKRWSDTHSLNTSIVELSLPYQFLFIIIQYRIELAIAKSKMFALIDLNVVPDKDGWNEEKTIYYADSIGMFFIDRNRIGVDKSFNQYQVVDLTMYQHITQLIGIQDFVVSRCDQLFGLTPQRKGQTQASDAVTNNERSVVQSSIISDYTFTSFEQFLEREYQGFTDLSKVENAESEATVYTNDDYGQELLKINPVEYCNACIGIYATNSSADREALEALKGLTTRLAQNPNVKISTLATMTKSQSYAEVMSYLKQVEAKEAELAQQMNQSEAEMEEHKNQLAKDFKDYENFLEAQLIDKEWDRKDQNTYIQGDIDLMKQNATPDINNNDIPDINEIEKRAIEREKIYAGKATEREKLALEKQKLNMQKYTVDEKTKSERYKADISLKVAKENKTKAELSKKSKK